MHNVQVVGVVMPYSEGSAGDYTGYIAACVAGGADDVIADCVALAGAV